MLLCMSLLCVIHKCMSLGVAHAAMKHEKVDCAYLHAVLLHLCILRQAEAFVAGSHCKFMTIVLCPSICQDAPALGLSGTGLTQLDGKSPPGCCNPSLMRSLAHLQV